MDKAMEDKVFAARITVKRMAAWANATRALAWAGAAAALTRCGWAEMPHSPGIGAVMLILGGLSAAVALCDFGGNLKKTLIGFINPEAGALIGDAADKPMAYDDEPQ